VPVEKKNFPPHRSTLIAIAEREHRTKSDLYCKLNARTFLSPRGPNFHRAG
jgi:hypothetical protein